MEHQVSCLKFLPALLTDMLLAPHHCVFANRDAPYHPVSDLVLQWRLQSRDRKNILVAIVVTSIVGHGSQSEKPQSYLHYLPFHKLPDHPVGCWRVSNQYCNVTMLYQKLCDCK